MSTTQTPRLCLRSILTLTSVVSKVTQTKLAQLNYFFSPYTLFLVLAYGINILPDTQVGELSLDTTRVQSVF